MKTDIHKLGTALRFVSRINQDTATSATITIKDPNDTTVVTDAAMSKAVDKVYFYIWQSTSYDDGGLEGVYKAIISITAGGFTGVAETQVKMEKTT